MEDIFIRMRYEGKVNFYTNLNNIKKTLVFLKKNLLPCIEVENICFGFVEKHIPRRQALVKILEAEHKEIIFLIKGLSDLVNKLNRLRSTISRTEVIDKLKEKGTYLNYFIRQHTQIENAEVFSPIDKELGPQEKQILLKSLKKPLVKLASFKIPL